MQLLRSDWLLQGVLPGGLAAVLAWLCLLNRFHGKGRLLGSRRSAGLAVAVCAAMACVAVVTNVLLPNATASRLRPVAVAVVGTGVSKRRRQQESVTQLAAAMSLGVARLLARLEERLEADRADWCDSMMEGLDNPWRTQMFIDEVKRHLEARALGSKSRQKAIDEHYAEIREAFETALVTSDRINPSGGHALTYAEERALRRTFGEADERCKLLLRLAHEYGLRTDDATLRRMRDRYRHAIAPTPPPTGVRLVRDREKRRRPQPRA